MINSDIKHICFDLDGTLVQSHTTIYKATFQSLVDLEISTENMNEEKFYTMIGHHFEDMFVEFGIPVNDFETFINVYKSHYFDFIDESKLYDDVEEIFSFLKSNNILISLLTTKGQEQADKIVDHFQLRKYFDLVMGRRNGIAHKPSPEPLLAICKYLNVNSDSTIMVGDTELDIQCGKNAKAKTIAITHGYRTKMALEEQEPDKMIDTLIELKNINF